MPKSKAGFDYVWVFICRLAKLVISIPSYKNSSARDVARCYYDRIYPIFRTPDSIVSDRGPQFTSKFHDEILRANRALESLLGKVERNELDGLSYRSTLLFIPETG